MKNWKVTGEVTVKGSNGWFRRYENLVKAVQAFGNSIEHLEHGRLSGYSKYELNGGRGDRLYLRLRYGDGWWLKGDPVIFVDELGMTIPVWKLKETWASHGVDRGSPWWDYYRGYKRNPGRGQNKRVFRNLRHWEEVEDEELGDRQANSLKSRHPPRVLAMWDDCERRSPRERSWKAYRRTQYKK